MSFSNLSLRSAVLALIAMLSAIAGGLDPSDPAESTDPDSGWGMDPNGRR